MDTLILTENQNINLFRLALLDKEGDLNDRQAHFGVDYYFSKYFC